MSLKNFVDSWKDAVLLKRTHTVKPLAPVVRCRKITRRLKTKLTADSTVRHMREERNWGAEEQSSDTNVSPGRRVQT